MASALPMAGAEALDDPAGDARGPDVVEVAWSLGNGTAAVEVRFTAGDLPAERAVRGVLLIGTPGSAEPAEWYQFTIANETTAYAGHVGPRPATLVATSWTGDLARVELRRESPAADGPCVFAVVEAGTLTDQGFTRSDVAPTGFSSPESAWPVDACPPSHERSAQAETEGKDSPGLGAAVVLFAALALASARRR